MKLKELLAAAGLPSCTERIRWRICAWEGAIWLLCI